MITTLNTLEMIIKDIKKIMSVNPCTPMIGKKYDKGVSKAA